MMPLKGETNTLGQSEISTCTSMARRISEEKPFKLLPEFADEFIDGQEAKSSKAPVKTEPQERFKPPKEFPP